jgi:hypothetical protein
VIQNWSHVLSAPRRDECVQRVQIPQQQGRRAELPPEGAGEHDRSALPGTPVS